MKTLISVAFATLLVGCSSIIPDMMKTIDSVATEDAITIQVDRDALNKDTDVHVLLDVVNKPVIK